MTVMVVGGSSGLRPEIADRLLSDGYDLSSASFGREVVMPDLYDDRF